MKVAVITQLSAERDMEIDPGHEESLEGGGLEHRFPFLSVSKIALMAFTSVGERDASMFGFGLGAPLGWVWFLFGCGASERSLAEYIPRIYYLPSENRFYRNLTSIPPPTRLKSLSMVIIVRSLSSATLY